MPLLSTSAGITILPVKTVEGWAAEGAGDSAEAKCVGSGAVGHAAHRRRGGGDGGRGGAVPAGDFQEVQLAVEHFELVEVAVEVRVPVVGPQVGDRPDVADRADRV